MMFNQRRLKPISTRATGPNVKVVMIPFGAIFMVVGVGVLIGLTVVPLLRWQAGQSWVETPCRIAYSAVATNRSSEGTTYSVDIRYTYTCQGRQYSSRRYSFVGVSSSGRSGKKAIVDRYPVGATAVCYVNPDNPTDAVLSREFQLFYLLGLIGLPLFLMGFGVLMYGVRKKPTADPSARLRRSAAPVTARMAAGGEQVLKPRRNPLVGLVVISIIAAVWNSVVAVILYQILGTRGLNGEAVAILLIFGGVGLALLGGVVYGILALFNPRVQIKVNPGAMPLGSTVALEWTVLGSTQRIARLRLWIEGREAATYRQGTKTRTAHNTFETIPIVEATDPNDMRTGRVQFAVPEFTMHSFDAPNNKIEWILKVHGDIPRWPDIKEEYAVTVLPLRPSA